MISRRRAFAVERNFGLVVGAAFLLLGSYWTLRHRFGPLGPAFGALGAVLFALGGLFPRALVVPNRAWMAFAEAMSFVMTRVVLALVFFVAVTPIGLIKRLTGWDPLRRRSDPAATYWVSYASRQRDPRHYERMF